VGHVGKMFVFSSCPRAAILNYYNTFSSLIS
jgi:hypothetical protein